MQRDSFDAKKKSGSSGSSATASSTTSDHATASSTTSEHAQAEDAQAYWKNLPRPSARMEKEIAFFEANAHHHDPEQRTFLLSDEQRTFCTWFSKALDIAFDQEVQQIRMTEQRFASATSCGCAFATTMLCACLSALTCAYLSVHVYVYVSIIYVCLLAVMYVCTYVCIDANLLVQIIDVSSANAPADSESVLVDRSGRYRKNYYHT